MSPELHFTYKHKLLFLHSFNIDSVSQEYTCLINEGKLVAGFVWKFTKCLNLSEIGSLKATLFMVFEWLIPNTQCIRLDLVSVFLVFVVAF